MRTFARRAALLLLSLIVAGASALPVRVAVGQEIPLDQRAQWFRHDRFGMFIHWGVYSVIGKGEWILETGRIPLHEYVKYYPQFHPAKFNAEQWVALAKRAGQKYIIITTKHHDGFCMFDSKLTDYSIMHTPLKRDVCKELADACHKAGIRIGFYYSIIDMARKLQPRMLVNDRANIGGDYQTPEQYIPATGVVDKQGRPAMWEVCMTMTTGHGAFAPTAWWGYDKHEKVFKPADELIQKLVDVASKGGNLLLNVGPTPEGEIRPEETARLEAIARWMSRHGEAIYGTTASPFRLLPFFGRVTQKGHRLYVHVFDWPEDRRLALPGLKTLPAAASMLEQPDAQVGASRETCGEMEQVVLRLPPKPTDPVDSVVVLAFDQAPQVEPLVLRPDAAGKLNLPAAMAEIHAEHGQRAKPVSKSGRTCIGNWSNPNDVVAWNFTLPKPLAFRVAIDGRPAAKEALGQRVEVSASGQKLVGKITADGVALDGTLNVPAGKQSISVKLLDAQRTGPPVLDLFALRLEPAKP